jgi:uncharacterized membrane protein YccC
MNGRLQAALRQAIEETRSEGVYGLAADMDLTFHDLTAIAEQLYSSEFSEDQKQAALVVALRTGYLYSSDGIL